MTDNMKPLEILLVEDNRDDAELIAHALAPERCHVVNAWNGRQALDVLLNENDIDVVLLDKNMPYKNGLEVLHTLKEQGLHYAVIFLTVDPTIEPVVEAMKLGALDFFPKKAVYAGLPDMIEKVHAIHQNRLEKNRLEDDLRERERQLQEAQRIAHLGSWEWDLVTGRQTRSDELYRILGYEPQAAEVTTETIKEQIHPDDRKYVETLSQRFLDGDVVDEIFEHRLIRPDGTEIVVQNRCRREQSTEGKSVKLCGTVLDITERKRNEEALQASEEKFAKAFHSNPAIIGMNDLKTDELIEVNQTFYEKLGFTPEEVIGKRASEIIRMDFRFRERTLAKLKKQHVVKNEEAVIYTKTGSPLHVLLSAVIISIGGTPYNFTTAIDVTERKQTEEALRETEERQRSLLNAISNSGILLFVVDAGYRVRYMNAPMLETFGDAVGKICYEGVGNRESPCPYCRLTDVIDSRKTVRYQPTVANGRTFNIVAVPYTDSDGSPCKLEVIQDITERVRAEEHIRRHNEFLRTIIESLTHPFYVIDVHDYNIVLANSRVRNMGSTETKTCYALTHKQNSPCQGLDHPCPMQELKRTKKPVMVEHVHYDQDGNPRTVEIHGFPIVNEAGDVVQMIEYTLDITGRKQAEEALRESEERFALFMDYLPAVAFIKDAESRSLFVNKYMRDVLGAKDWIGKTVLELYSKEIAEAMIADDHNALSAGHVMRVETVPHDDGSEHIYQTQKFAIERPGKSPLLGGIALNITERVQAEEQLQKNEARYRTLFEEAAISLWEQDFSDVKQYFDGLRESGIADMRAYCQEHPEAVWQCASLVHTLDVNRATLELYNAHSRQELFDNFQNIFCEESLNGLMEGFIAVAEGKTFCQHETLNRNLSGQQRHLLVRWAVVSGYEKSYERVLVSSLDITERKQAEEELKKAKEAAEIANRAKSDFLSNMSHELRTPLNGILGYAQILTRDQDLTALQQERLDIIQRSGMHLLTLITDILDLAKIEAGKVEIMRDLLQLPEFLKTIEDMISIRAYEKGLDFTCELAPDLPTAVYGDNIRLRQILLNLLGNAVKFTEKGSVTLKVSSVECRVSSEATHHSSLITLHFSIEDTGIGIPPEKIADIFLPFEQAGDTPFLIKGTGLGLAISQRLAFLMGSRILAKSTVGQGSTLWFEMDFPEVDEPAVSTATPSQTNTGVTEFRPNQAPRSPEPASENQAFVLPPAVELDTLADIVNRGMIIEVRQWLDRVEHLDAQYAPFTTHIRHLSDTFNFQAMRTLLKQIKNEMLNS